MLLSIFAKVVKESPPYSKTAAALYFSYLSQKETFSMNGFYWSMKMLHDL